MTSALLEKPLIGACACRHWLRQHDHVGRCLACGECGRFEERRIKDIRPEA